MNTFTAWFIVALYFGMLAGMYAAFKLGYYRGKQEECLHSLEIISDWEKHTKIYDDYVAALQTSNAELQKLVKEAIDNGSQEG